MVGTFNLSAFKPSMKASEVCRETRNQLFERGWHKGSLEGSDGTVCLIGAAVYALGGEVETPRVLTSTGKGNTFYVEDGEQQFRLRAIGQRVAMTDFMTVMVEELGGRIPDFNDHVETKFDDVCDALERAEKRASIIEARRPDGI